MTDEIIRVRWLKKPKGWEVELLNLLADQKDLLTVIKRILMDQETRHLERQSQEQPDLRNHRHMVNIEPSENVRPNVRWTTAEITEATVKRQPTCTCGAPPDSIHEPICDDDR